jgi:hypothetical protein
MIGYAVSLTNRALGLELFGSPQEVLEQLQARGLIPGEVATRRETVLSYKKVFKAHPQMEFSGGPHAEAVLLLLDAIHRSDPAGAASILADDPALLTDRDREATLIFGLENDRVPPAHEASVPPNRSAPVTAASSRIPRRSRRERLVR